MFKEPLNGNSVSNGVFVLVFCLYEIKVQFTVDSMPGKVGHVLY